MSSSNFKMNDVIKSFEDNGFYIQKNVYTKNDFEELFNIFYDLALSCALRNNIPFDLNKFPTNESASYPEDLSFLDKILLIILRFDKALIGELYDTFSYSSGFLRFVSNKEVEKMSKLLLKVENNTTLYGWTNRVRIDPPGDNRRTYGWHQEVFYTMPRFRYLQTWAPILRDTTVENGTINIKPGSHKEGIAAQTWNEVEGRATQILIDKDILSKYKSVKLEMKVGDVLYFDGHLAHASGNNTTENEIRFSLVGMWNDTSTKEFKAPLPCFKSRVEEPIDYFRNIFGSKRIRNL